ncbi:MAG: hypothetical protein GY739_16760, partial [Mesoflavibacter sp.]|nr:hypothetical protein [Mesoflavibacter sp.]
LIKVFFAGWDVLAQMAATFLFARKFFKVMVETRAKGAVGRGAGDHAGVDLADTSGCSPTKLMH